ncbi:hypothetical protein D3C87_1476420 [compost metagenome]
MLANGFGNRHEDHAGLGQFRLEGGDDGHAVEHRIHGHAAVFHAGQEFLFLQRNAELLVNLQQFRIDLVQRLRAGGAFRCGIIIEIVEVDLGIADARPCRLFHRQPALVSLKTPFQHPFRLLLLGRDEADNLFRKALRGLVDFDLCLEAVFILVHIDLADLIDRFLNRCHVVLQSRRSQGPVACQRIKAESRLIHLRANRPCRINGRSLYPCKCGMALFTHPGKRKIAIPQFFAAFYAA